MSSETGISENLLFGVYGYDWFHRNKDFVLFERGEPFWEDKDAEHYSEYFFDTTKEFSKKELITKAVSKARAIILAFNLPKRVGVRLNPNSSFTDGVCVTIASDVFDKPIPLGYQMDAFCGYVVHEAGHIKYTDFDLVKKEVVKDSFNTILKGLWNIIEDV